MAVRIKFDNTHNVIPPTLVLTTRNGRRLGQIPAYNIQFKDGLNESSEMTFRVSKLDCVLRANDIQYVKKSPIVVYNTVHAVNGYDLMGTLSNDQLYELIQYAMAYDKLSDVSIRFVGQNTEKTYLSPSIDYDGNYETIYFKDRNTNSELIKVDSNGSVYIYYAGRIGLSVNESVLIELGLTIPTSFSADKFWRNITDFKLCWVRDWDMYYEIDVDVDETNDIIKIVSAKSLAESELSQVYVYNLGINTEDDIARDDYKPTVLYNADPSISLLDRVLEKAPHYAIGHVDSSIASIQRTFSFDNKTVYDALIEIGKEINCLIVMEAYTDQEGKLTRVINAYDLEQQCLECGERGDFSNKCPNCGSDNILSGYGKDTSILVTTDNLANNVTYSVDNGSVKNCFKLEAGDDLMTATIANCNPNGSAYIWNISDHSKEDMSFELVRKLAEYDEKYRFYQKDFVMQVPSDIRTRYNSIIQKYKSFDPNKKEIAESIKGYASIMQAYYDTIDLYYFLNNELMPTVELAQTTASLEAAKLSYASLSPVAVKNIDVASSASVDSAVLAMAKSIIDSRYTVKITESTYVNQVWSGVFYIVNNSDEDDAANSSRVSCLVNDDYETFVKQRIEKALKKNATSEDGVDIISLFENSTEQFKIELRKYSLSRLESFHDSCQACLDILIQQGISNDEAWSDKNPNLYMTMYTPYYDKLGVIESEMKVRESEIEVVSGKYDADGALVSQGIQTIIDDTRVAIQDALNFQNHLGDNLWLEFCAYRREGTYHNPNYISDGLDNAGLFQLALQFIEVAEKEILKSSTLQHSISSSLKNLLAIKEFEPIIDSFELGNWIRVRIDDEIYKLRLIHYELNFDNFDSISIEFSDVTQYGDITTDVADVIDQAASMATSYPALTRQAKKGSEGNNLLNAWVDRGLALTKMKIVDSADNQNITWDSHGLLCREYLPITDNYDDKQLKIINRGLYLTDDNWRTSKAGIGDFTFYNPKTKQYEYSYGVIADLLVGNLVLSEEVGIYNENNSLSIDRNGFMLTSYADGDKPIFTIQRENGDGSITKLLHLNEQGKLVLNGSIYIGGFGDLDNLASGIVSANEKAQLAEKRSIVSMVSQYTSSTSGTIQPSTGWQEAIPAVSPGNYLWTRITYTYGDGSTRYSYTVSRQGVNGSTGSDGANGTNGNDGLSSATIMLYKRSESLPSAPNVNITYTFSTASLSSNLSGWNVNIPDGTSPCYVIKANVVSTNSSVIITPTQWSTPVILVQNGTVDYSGINQRFEELSQNIYDNLESYKPAIDQYMSFDNVNGLILGSKEESAQFKVQITNDRIAFIENDDVTAYINSNQLYITNAVITSSLYVGGYYFTPLFTTQNGEQKPNGMAIVWKGDIGNA